MTTFRSSGGRPRLSAASIPARPDPRLTARVVRRTPLLYADGPDAGLDRPGHVRAASGLTRMDGELVVVQDDANFVALVDPTTGRVRSVALPAGEDGSRQFDDVRGNKQLKLDLESCVSLVVEDGPELLLAFGSGATASRERIVVLADVNAPKPRVDVVHAGTLYAALRAEHDFSGSELNLEGAVLVDGRVRLFGRGNGREREGRQPVNATCDLDTEHLLGYLSAPGCHTPPFPRDVVQVELGEIDGVRVGFTGAARAGRAVLFTGVAEASPDAISDGPVLGAVLGVIAGATARWTPLTWQGRPWRAKVEGLELASPRADRGWLVVDHDDPGAASELCDVELWGPWLEPANSLHPLPET